MIIRHRAFEPRGLQPEQIVPLCGNLVARRRFGVGANSRQEVKEWALQMLKFLRDPECGDCWFDVESGQELAQTLVAQLEQLGLRPMHIGSNYTEIDILAENWQRPTFANL